MAGKKSNPKKKAACAASWARAELRKAARREAQEAAARRNAASPDPTPWERAKMVRTRRRPA